ncbi:MAG: sulfatase-like hydrolase/transferase [Candidatus Palauibacterales bacterium]|nr:sulfatase-like hydrolase/transferase [Candidatus Palauibacterales bacterium]MDP2481788.1 sulfatase-like hydrolase/transferase [Candidatus Palauibacterales bacterium]
MATILAMASLAVACADATSPVPEDAPNVVLIIVDDLRWDAVGSLAPASLSTPSIDRLANEGITFDQAFVVQSVCKPSRASMFTGLYAHSHGVRTNVDDWTQKQKNIFRAMEVRGYRVGYVGKWHLGGKTPPDWADRWVSLSGQGEYVDPVLDIDGAAVPYSGHSIDALTEHAIRFVRAAGNQRFFLVLSHNAAHAPFVPQDRWRGTVDPGSLEIPSSFYDDLSDQPAFLRERAVVRNESTLRLTAEAYYELVRGVDESVGRLLTALEDQGILDQTLVILIGDNGYLLGEHHLLDKRVAFEESMRVPLIVRYPPWFDGGEHSDGFALNVDLPATIMHAVTGRQEGFPSHFLPVPRVGIDQSLKLTADGAHRQAFLYEYFQDSRFPVTPTLRAVRTPEFKYVSYEDPAQIDELYDLRSDPLETRNLVGEEQYRQVLAALKLELEDLRVATGDR